MVTKRVIRRSAAPPFYVALTRILPLLRFVRLCARSENRNYLYPQTNLSRGASKYATADDIAEWESFTAALESRVSALSPVMTPELAKQLSQQPTYSLPATFQCGNVSYAINGSGFITDLRDASTGKVCVAVDLDLSHAVACRALGRYPLFGVSCSSHGQVWASENHTIGGVHYQTFTLIDYDTFASQVWQELVGMLS